MILGWNVDAPQASTITVAEQHCPRQKIPHIMQFSTALMVLATLSSPSVSAPVEPRANFDPPPGGDVTILNYALTLEYLERKFYQQGLANYTEDDFCEAGFSSDFYKNLKNIYFDEQVSLSYRSKMLCRILPDCS